MKKKTVILLAVSLATASLSAQSSKTALIYALNLGIAKTDIRLGEEKAPVYERLELQPLAPLPMTEIAPATDLKLYAKSSGASAWAVVKGRSEGDLDAVRLHAIEAGHVYCVVVYPAENGVSVGWKDCTADANGPKIQLVNGTRGPVQFEVGTDQGKGEGLEPSGYIGPSDLSPFYALKAKGAYGIFFGSFLWEDGKKAFYAAKEDPSKPARIAFQDGAYYAAIARVDESGDVLFAFQVIPSAAAAAAAATAATAPPASLAAVPASWNGDYAEESRPGRTALSVHDGKIWSVFGSSQTETFPGPSRLYQFLYGEKECRSVEKGNGKEFERYLFDPKTGKLTYTMAGQAPAAYVPMKGK